MAAGGGEGRCSLMRPEAELRTVLMKAGFRVTRTRLMIGQELWSGPGSRHIDAAALHSDILASGGRVSLASVYNTLRDFERAGFIRRIAVASERIWYDTDTGNHRHFHDMEENRLFDAPDASDDAGAMPEPPDGYRIVKVDTVFHLERID